MSTLKARDAFDNLGRETEQSERHIEQFANSQIARLGESYREAVRECREILGYNSLNVRRILNKHKIYEIESKDIEQFSLVLPQYYPEDVGDEFNYDRITGIFLNECLNRCLDDLVNVHTKHLSYGLVCLGLFNKGKHIIINGDTLSGTGNYMQSGKIEVLGNGGASEGGGVAGGELIFKGNVRGNIGSNMRGGVIRVYGNALDPYPGLQATDGEIYIEGDIVYNHSVSGEYWRNESEKSLARVYHKGKLITRKTDGSR